MVVINSVEPNIVFTDFKLFNKSVYPKQTDSPLELNIDLCKEIELNYMQNIFTISFAALNYIIPEKNQYKFKLEGFDSEWQSCKTVPEATYMNLPPGEYVFKVIASNNDGVWNNEGRELLIKVLPPWWSTWWFRSVFVCLVIIVILLFVFFRIRNIKKQNKLLEQLVNERTQKISDQAAVLQVKNKVLNEQKEELLATSTELIAQSEMLNKTNAELEVANQTKNKLFSIIAHDIKNPFGVVMNFSEILNKSYDNYSEDKRKLFIKKIFSASTSIYAILDNLLNWARTQSDSIVLNQEQFDLVQIIYLIVEQYQILIEDKAIVVEINPQYDNIFVVADINMTKAVLRNILGNALKFTPENGSIKVNVFLNEAFVNCEIIDSGIGIPKEKIQSIFTFSAQKLQNGTQKEAGTGLGMLICKEFVEKNKGTISIESVEMGGTKVAFTLPIG
ncbi:MAG: hypothetical protein IPO21_20565 [Bacteroidales bacterium]|nr:hypothetical protein [Bacteroidales bacterium]